MHLEEIERIKIREKEFQGRIESESKELKKLTEETEDTQDFRGAFKEESKSGEGQVFCGELERVPAAGIE